MQNKLLISIIILILLVVIGGGVGIYYLLKQQEQTTTKSSEVALNKKINPADETLSEVGPLYPLTPFTVNLKNKDDKDIYLKTTLSLELDSKLLENELNSKNAVIRNQIIMILTSKTLEDISSTFGKIKVCNEIKSSLNKMLKDGQIRNVYIASFIVE